MTAVPRVGALVMLLAIAGCSGDQILNTAATPGVFQSAPGQGVAFATPAEQRPIPPVEMMGRWLLASSGAGQCGMIFTGSPGAREGTIAPEGGCPGQFFTSRKWDFEPAGLVIRDHNDEPLAQLTLAGGARFEGKATSGEQITLTR